MAEMKFIAGQEEWYAAFLARKAERRRTGSQTKLFGAVGPVMCKQCGVREVAKGKSSSCRSAAKVGLCARCYNSPDPDNPGRRRQEGEYGYCELCEQGVIAEGDSPTSVYARKNGLCRKCYANGGALRLIEKKRGMASDG